MKIFVDADACPVKDIVIALAKQYGIGVVLVFSISHQGSRMSGYEAEKIMVDNESQAADMAIMNRISAGDILVTGDFGLASLALGKRAAAISNNGKIYDAGNIDQLLFERHLSQQIRRSGGRTKGPVKRSREEDQLFLENLEKLILKK